MLNHTESYPVKVFHDALNLRLRVLGNYTSNMKHCWQWLSIKGLFDCFAERFW